MEKRRLIFLALALLLVPMMLAGFASADECSKECSEKICVNYFYSPTCSACQSIKEFIDETELKYSDNIVLHRLDVRNASNFEIYNSFCSIQNLSIEKRGIPLIVTKNDFLMGTQQIRESLEKDIEDLIANNRTGCVDSSVCSSITQTGSNHTQTIITFPLIALAAAADSINPCAIGVLIFLIGFLLLSSGKNYKRTLKIAAIYIFTVYIVYMLAGIGILELLSKLSFLSIIPKLFALVVFILGAINIYDAFNNKTEGTLAIPTKAKPLIEKWVYKSSIPAAIILGFIVAAVELPCTGGMYLAILTLMSQTISRNTAIIYLLFYNFIFVLPLIIITLFFIKGFEAETLQSWLEKHKKKSRLIMGLVLIMVGISLLLI